MTPIFTVIKEKGQWKTLDRERLESYKRGLKDGEYELVLRKKQKRKSRQYEKYYWPVCVKLWAAHYGETIKAAHEMLLLQCAPRDEKGEVIRSSDERFTLEVQLKFVEDVRMFMGAHDCPTPDPNEVET